MVRSVTFEIRWHDTQPIYSCSFQPIASNHLRRVLDHNLGQAAGLAPGKTLADLPSAGPGPGPSPSSSSATASSSSTATAKPLPVQPPVMAGGQSWRLATAGGDNNARLWMVHPNIPSPAALASAASTSRSAPIAPHPPRVEYLATLTRHSGVVNVVRFCPRGELLATAGDDGNVLFWVPSDRSRPGFGDAHGNLQDEDHQFEKEFWRVKLMTRATPQEIYDMAWSPNGETLAVGGTDFVARIINVQDGHVIREISEHSHYIQGIAWDPLQEFIATQSSDRAVHIHSLHTKQKHDHSDPSASASLSITGSHLASRATKLDLHRRNGSGNGTFVWDSSAKPPMKRRASSHASQASDSEGGGQRESFVASLRGRSKRSSTPMDPHHPHPGPLSASGTGTGTGTASGRATTPVPTSTPAPLASASASVRPATPNASVPPSPFSSASAAGMHAMNPPQTTPSRRSSFSGSNLDVASPPTSVTSLAPAPAPSQHVGGSSSRSASRARSIRSPSPIPPLPAIRAPPSPKQRIQPPVPLAAGTGVSTGTGTGARSTLRLYGDENFSGFFRRLAFSPDGGILATPSGLYDPPPPPAAAAAAAAVMPTSPVSPHKSPTTTATATATAAVNKSAVYLYARGNFARSNSPIAVLPGHKTATLVVRFSPILYELRRAEDECDATDADAGGGAAPHPTIPLEVGKAKSVPLAVPGRSAAVIGLPYRMVYAVATQDSVWIYDTQQTGPVCCFSNMHYASFTDLTWSPDGQTLMMSSTDGYCSVVVFDYAELGTPYRYTGQPALQLPAPGTPAPSHIAHGSEDPAPAPASSAAGALGLAITTPTPAPAPAPAPVPAVEEGPKKKRRIAPTLERPLGT